jgi:hypothetical protein
MLPRTPNNASMQYSRNESVFTSLRQSMCILSSCCPSAYVNMSVSLPTSLVAYICLLTSRPWNRPGCLTKPLNDSVIPIIYSFIKPFVVRTPQKPSALALRVQFTCVSTEFRYRVFTWQLSVPCHALPLHRLFMWNPHRFKSIFIRCIRNGPSQVTCKKTR